jgi:L,D-peptidoglycan transpeptidase YkuD (ErfK/YbiS/YcfS/YnhG family)
MPASGSNCGFAVAIGRRGIAPAEQLPYLGTPAGLVYGRALVAFAAMPALVHGAL